MKDQAYGLRQLRKRPSPAQGAGPQPKGRTIAVTSGKGGVGKTNLVANLAVSLSAQGRSVTVLDADLSLGNLDILLRVHPERTLADVLLEKAKLTEIAQEGLGGVRVIPAALGVQELTRLDTETRQRLCNEILSLATEDTILIVDTGAGVSDNVIDLVLNSAETIIVTSREPTAIIDAYAVVKILNTRGYRGTIRFVVNMVNSMDEGRWVFERLQAVAERHLDVKLDYLGHVLRDANVVRSICQQAPIVLEQPDSPAAECFLRLAERLLELESADSEQVPTGLHLVERAEPETVSAAIPSIAL